MKKEEVRDVILSIAGWMGGYVLSILFWPEHNNATELMLAIVGALAYAFGRQYHKKKGMKNKEK